MNNADQLARPPASAKADFWGMAESSLPMREHDHLD
jgi:hypothetical protein